MFMCLIRKEMFLLVMCWLGWNLVCISGVDFIV